MDARVKWDRIYNKAGSNKPTACSSLIEYQYLLPQSGEALDLACGLGGNALLLAQCGLQTTAIDISPVAIGKLQRLATDSGLTVNAVAQSVTADSLGANRYDVITVSNYFDRELAPAISAALKPDGLLFYQTFVNDKTGPDAGPSNPEFLLKPNELLRLFPALSIVVYSDLGRVGDTTAGLRNQSFLVGRSVAG
ncbi:hypothetical protein AB833_23675 [Chromatiales bacterium (ex Bugula neritina AB1)]|nr:hypothetical protein AB833_23675 [Chromatiales bacterium (ex Bugula neritina AB1)]